VNVHEDVISLFVHTNQFITSYMCFKCLPSSSLEWWTPLVNGCVNLLFNAVPNVYFQNWKTWVMLQQSTNNIALTS